jgi:hypothetical protein
MSRRTTPTIHGVLAESALVLLEQQRLVWPREVVLRAWDLHAELFELEQRRLVMQAAEREAKAIMKDLTEDDEEEEDASSWRQLTLRGLALPTAIALPDHGGDDGAFPYVRTDKATWSDLVAGGEIRDRNIERAQAKRDAYWESVDYLRPVMEKQPNLTVAEALRIIRPGQVA